MLRSKVGKSWLKVNARIIGNQGPLKAEVRAPGIRTFDTKSSTSAAHKKMNMKTYDLKKSSFCSHDLNLSIHAFKSKLGLA